MFGDPRTFRTGVGNVEVAGDGDVGALPNALAARPLVAHARGYLLGRRVADHGSLVQQNEPWFRYDLTNDDGGRAVAQLRQLELLVEDPDDLGRQLARHDEAVSLLRLRARNDLGEKTLLGHVDLREIDAHAKPGRRAQL